MTTEAERHSELERTYDAPIDAVVPDLVTLPGVREVARPVELEQVATYYDTADLRLLSAHVTLRRRTGGVDDGWHLKVPSGRERPEEMRLPLTGEDGEVPAALLDRVRAQIRDAPIAPAAVLTTRRAVHALRNARGAVLAELCDDRVRAETSSGGAALEEWREWELELLDGPDDLLDAAGLVLVEAGARPAVTASKLSRLLGPRLPARSAWRRSTKLPRTPSTADVLLAYLADHVVVLEEEDRLLRTGDQEGVHKLRVAARRLRSALSTYSPVLEPGPTRWLRDELKWLGGALGDARDAQVLEKRLDTLLHQQPDELVLGPVAARLDDEFETRLRSGHLDARHAVNGERYFRLLDGLEAFLDAPPLGASAQVRARRMVPGLLHADLKRVRKRHRAVRRATDPAERDLALHDVRKASKRLRYAAESARPVFGKRAKRLAARAERLQELLGDHQDSVVARRTLGDIGVRAHLAGENGFTYGRLQALEEARGDEMVRAYPDSLSWLKGKDLRTWLH